MRRHVAHATPRVAGVTCATPRAVPRGVTTGGKAWRYHGPTHMIGPSHVSHPILFIPSPTRIRFRQRQPVPVPVLCRACGICSRPPQPPACSTSVSQQSPQPPACLQSPLLCASRQQAPFSFVRKLSNDHIPLRCLFCPLSSPSQSRAASPVSRHHRYPVYISLSLLAASTVSRNTGFNGRDTGFTRIPAAPRNSITSSSAP